MFTLTTRKVIAGVLVVLSVLVVFWLVIHFLNELVLAFTGIVISISMAPAVEWLHQHKLPRAFSVIFIYLFLGIIFSGFFLLITSQMTQQVTALTPRFEYFYAAVKSSLQNSPSPLVRQWVSNLLARQSLSFTPDTTGTGGATINSLGWTLSIFQSILGGLFTLSAVFLIGFYWTLEGERVEYTFSMLFPAEKRERTRQILKDIEGRVGGFVRGQGLLALTIGALALAAYALIGLPSVLSLAFLAGVFELVPVVGPILGALPALLVTLAAQPSRLGWVILATILIQLLENHLLAPRIMKRTVGVNPMVTILSITGFGFLFGFSGLWMAIPLAAMIQVLLDRSLLHPAGAEVKAPAGRDRLSKLSYEAQEYVQDIRKRVRSKEARTAEEACDEIEDEIESIAADLDGILAQTIETDHSP